MLIIKARLAPASATKQPVIKVLNAKTDDSCLSVYHDHKADLNSNCERAVMTYINQNYPELMCWNVVEQVKIGDWHLFVIVTDNDVLLFNRSN